MVMITSGRLRSAFRAFVIGRHIFSTTPPPADARIPYGDDPLNFGDLRLPKFDVQSSKFKVPVVVVIHGGFWRARYDLEHIGHACAALTSAGYATWSLEYRRIGNPGGGWPGTFHDVGAGVDFLRELAPQHNLDLDRVVVIGHSAGGHLALWVAGRSRIPPGDPLHSANPLPIRGAVSLAGVAGLRRAWELQLSNGVVTEFLGGSPDEVPQRYASASPIELVPLNVPQALVHGTKDENVPYEISERYHAAAQEKGDRVELVTLRGAGHFEVIDPKMKEWRKVVEAVSKLLGEPPGP